METSFPLGQTVIARAALDMLHLEDVTTCLDRWREAMPRAATTIVLTIGTGRSRDIVASNNERK